jgi:hypothetical protein
MFLIWGWRTREASAVLLRIDDPAGGREAAVRALSDVAGREWSEEELDADLVHNDANGLGARSQKLAEVMNEHGRERFLATAAAIAASGGTVLSDSRDALTSMAADLGMTPAHARGVIDHAVEAAQHPG